jgi:NAD(P)-dependent dehydrogenase (short-subunit alcohol dehydrogenase family)
MATDSTELATSTPTADRSQEMGFAGRVVITGASRGLGRALAERYLATGWEVWAGCRDVAGAIELGWMGAVLRELDVSDEGSIDKFATEVAETGGVDVLINNAATDAREFGSTPDLRGPLDIAAEAFLAEMRVNAAGPMLVTRALHAPLLESQGKVINMSSRLSSMIIGANLCWDIGYNASKAALNAITVRTAALLVESGVVVVAVHPGSVRTGVAGPDVPLTPTTVADALILTISSLNLESSGRFIQYDGRAHPW